MKLSSITLLTGGLFLLAGIIANGAGNELYAYTCRSLSIMWFVISLHIRIGED